MRLHKNQVLFSIGVSLNYLKRCCLKYRYCYCSNELDLLGLLLSKKLY